MKAWKNTLLVVALGTAAAAVGWWRLRETPSDTSETVSSSKPAAPPLKTWPFQTEEHWMADSIVRDIAEMLLFAADKSGLAQDGLSVEVHPAAVDGKFDITLKSARGEACATLALQHHLWAEENFIPLAAKLVETFHLTKPGPKIAAENSLDAFAMPHVPALAQESIAVSEALTRDPLDAVAHEQAALLCACVALREAAGYYDDTRPLLNRACAHLAIAGALESTQGPCAEVARALILTLSGRETEAIDNVAKWPASRSAWARVIRLRSNMDWHEAARGPKMTLLEQFELARSLVRTAGPHTLPPLLGIAGLEKHAEWSRLVMQGEYGVKLGHQFVSDSLEMETAEAVETRQVFGGPAAEGGEFVKLLNAPATRAVTRDGPKNPRIESLSWGNFAAFHQRHICQSISNTMIFLADHYGVPEQAADFTRAAETEFGKLALFPFVRAVNGPRSRVTPEAVVLLEMQPQLVTCLIWTRLSALAKNTNTPNPLAWFHPVLPVGTTYDFAARYYELHELYKAPVIFWDELLATAPRNYNVMRTHAYKHHGAKLTPEQSAKTFELIKDYHLTAMREMSDVFKKDPTAYAQHLEKIAELDPNVFIELGGYLLASNLIDKAAAAYQAGFDRAQDRVLVANNCQWLVQHYFENGRKGDALKIAQQAAEVYSHRGLETMAWLQEQMGQLDEAEKYHAAVVERYGEIGSLGAFYQRHRADHPEYEERIKALSLMVFPEGQQNVTLADFTGPPVDGAVIASESSHSRKAQLTRGHIIVALDGVRVQNEKQYLWVRDLKQEAPLALIIWNGAKYFEISANPPHRLFNCDINDYRK